MNSLEKRSPKKCRVCLGEETEVDTMYDLFRENKTKTSNGRLLRLRLSEKVEFCCGVKIRESPEMPTKICLRCFDMTRMWFNFRQMCVNSQVYLESLCEKDRLKPVECNEEDYLELLLDDLQMLRADMLQSNSDDGVFPREWKNDTHYDSDTMDEREDDVMGGPGMDSDSEFENVIQNIKKEEDEDVDAETAAETEAVEGANRERGLMKKKKAMKRETVPPKKPPNSSYIKKAFRPPSPTSYMCSICGNVYAKRASFHYHMTLHSNVKPHECELCGKAFRQVCELKNHMRRHTGEKPYKCNFCDRHFIDRSERHRHERVHTNTRPYKCNVCGKSFMYSAILKNHSKLHSGEKDYNCLVCHKAFTLQHQLKAHLQTITHKQKEDQLLSAGYEVLYE